MTQRVLVIHGSDDLRQLTERALVRMGVDVQFAANGSEGILLLSERPYTIILVDEDLAEGLIAWIAEHREHRPVVILTTRVAAENRDPDVVSLVMAAPYDPAMVAGVVMACVSESDGVIAQSAGVPLPAFDTGRGEAT